MNEQKARVAVLVSGGGTNLQAILDAEKNGIISSGRVCLVISNRKDAYALQRAADAGVPAVCISRKKYASQEEFEDSIASVIEENKIDLIVLAGFLAILGENFVKRFEHRIINIHPSLIPSFCGAGFYGLKVHQAALERGVKLTGATVHFVNEIPDGGEILAQKAVEIQDDDTPEELQLRVMREAEWIILPDTVERLCGKIIKGESL